MAILEKEIEISLRGGHIGFYEELGYMIPRKINSLGKRIVDYNKTLIIKVGDLPEGSTFEVTKICDECGKKVFNQRYNAIVACRKSGDGKDRCRDCGYKKGGESNHARCSYEESLEYHCKSNSLESLLIDFNENNNIHPSKIFKNSGRKYRFKCQRCGTIKSAEPRTVLRNGFSCRKCGDGISYAEKFMFNMLAQLDIDFEYQKKFDWLDDRFYDFYIPSLNCIIETHGLQHYIGWGNMGNLEEIQHNDLMKERLANDNHIEHYIVIDCRESELGWIKNSVLKSKLRDIIDLSQIDWVKSHEYSCSTLVKVICDLWNSGMRSAGEIANIIKLSRNTVAKYLRQGRIVGWCDYDPDEANRDSGRRAGKSKRMPIVQLTLDGEYIQEWESMAEVEKRLGISNSKISLVCKGKRSTAGGFRWVYKDVYLENKDNLNSIITLNKAKTRVVQLTQEGKLIKKWDSITDARIGVGLKSTGSISDVCRGVSDTSKGFKWMYLEDYESMIAEQAKDKDLVLQSQ